jgi:hypothetical protein
MTKPYLAADGDVPGARAVADDKRRMVSVDYTCERLNESRSYFYKHSFPKLRHYKAGRATRIDDTSTDELIAQRLADNPLNPRAKRRGRPRKQPAAQSVEATQ